MEIKEVVLKFLLAWLSKVEMVNKQELFSLGFPKLHFLYECL